MPHVLWLFLLVIILVVVAQYVTEGLFRMCFYLLAVVVAVYAVVRLTGIG